jgi:hypothetical protein
LADANAAEEWKFLSLEDKERQNKDETKSNIWGSVCSARSLMICQIGLKQEIIEC